MLPARFLHSTFTQTAIQLRLTAKSNACNLKVKASNMLYATRNDYGNCFIHIISHFSQDTVAIHLTLVQDPSIHVRGSNAHGK